MVGQDPQWENILEKMKILQIFLLKNLDTTNYPWGCHYNLYSFHEYLSICLLHTAYAVSNNWACIIGETAWSFGRCLSILWKLFEISLRSFSYGVKRIRLSQIMRGKATERKTFHTQSLRSWMFVEIWIRTLFPTLRCPFLIGVEARLVYLGSYVAMPEYTCTYLQIFIDIASLNLWRALVIAID